MVIFHSYVSLPKTYLESSGVPFHGPGSFTPAPLRRERPQADHRDTGLSWGAGGARTISLDIMKNIMNIMNLIHISYHEKPQKISGFVGFRSFGVL